MSAQTFIENVRNSGRQPRFVFSHSGGGGWRGWRGRAAVSVFVALEIAAPVLGGEAEPLQHGGRGPGLVQQHHLHCSAPITCVLSQSPSWSQQCSVLPIDLSAAAARILLLLFKKFINFWVKTATTVRCFVTKRTFCNIHNIYSLVLRRGGDSLHTLCCPLTQAEPHMVWRRVSWPGCGWCWDAEAELWSVEAVCSLHEGWSPTDTIGRCLGRAPHCQWSPALGTSLPPGHGTPAHCPHVTRDTWHVTRRDIVTRGCGAIWLGRLLAINMVQGIGCSQATDIGQKSWHGYTGHNETRILTNQYIYPVHFGVWNQQKVKQVLILFHWRTRKLTIGESSKSLVWHVKPIYSPSPPVSCEPPSVARSTDSDRNPPLICHILVSSVCGVGWRGEVSVPPIITTADYSPDAATLRVFASQPRVETEEGQQVKLYWIWREGWRGRLIVLNKL